MKENRLPLALRFNRPYFLVAATIFLVEIYIALYVRDSFVRPYVGDFLVVIFLYALIMAFLTTPWCFACAFVLLLAFLVELAQYFHLLKILGLQHVKWANILFGNSFVWADLVAYTLGALAVVVFELAAQRWPSARSRQHK
jgi:hypothetical protein